MGADVHLPVLQAAQSNAPRDMESQEGPKGDGSSMEDRAALGRSWELGQQKTSDQD